MFRVSQHPSSGVLKTVTAASGTVHNTGTATSLQRGLIRPLGNTTQHNTACCHKTNWNSEINMTFNSVTLATTI